jgi:acyl-CoA thioesterase-1
MSNWLVGHIVSGHAFFSGVLLVLLAILLQMRCGSVIKRCTPVTLILGVILIALSSAPLPVWYYALAAIVTITWLCTSRWGVRYHSTATAISVLVWMTGVALELPYHFLPRLQAVSERSITILGDSVTAGLEEKEAETWPNLLRRAHHVKVQDLSHVGEIAASALKRVRKNQLESTLVVVEIGGNDLLGFTTAEQFAFDLEELLKYLTAQHCQVAMLELPLPPFYHAYGRAQRTLASRYHVALVPKRVFLKVLAADSATLDSIHLSQAGHQIMAESIWEIVRPAMPAE